MATSSVLQLKGKAMFLIGDRVRLRDRDGYHTPTIGTVIGLDDGSDDLDILVQWHPDAVPVFVDPTLLRKLN